LEGSHSTTKLYPHILNCIPQIGVIDYSLNLPSTAWKAADNLQPTTKLYPPTFVQ